MRRIVIIVTLLFFTGGMVMSQGIDKPQYQIITKRAGNYLGTFNIELFPLIAPMHVHNFDSLTAQQFFDSTAFHRVVPGFVIQGGDPNSIHGPVSTWGQGQPWQPTVPAEFSVVRHLRGIIGAARDTGINSANSQFYVCVANATFLDGNYTVFGKVISGMDVVDTIVNSPRDANDVPLQKIEMFVTYTGVNDSIPDPPVLTSPADGSTGLLNTQSYTWSSVNSAVMYTLEFSTDPNFSTINISKNSGTNSGNALEVQGSTTYYWRVKSNNGGHESIYSNVYSFTTATAAPLLTYPTDLATGVPVNPIFTWDPAPNATSYTLQVSTSSTFTAASMIYNTAGLTSTSQQVSGMNPNSVYYWRVRSANGTQQGFYSAKFSFTTGTTSTGISEVNENISMLSAYPNPSNDFITVDVYTKNSEDCEFILTDKLGRIVFSKTLSTISHNKSATIPVANLADGIYFLTVKSGSDKVVRKVSKN